MTGATAVADLISVPVQPFNSAGIPLELDKVCVVAFEDNAPPWRNDHLWRAAGSTLRYLIHLHQDRLNPSREAAGCIKNLLSGIDDMLDRLGKKTCARCIAPCCRVADVSYDFRDLLYIHMTDQVIPPGQPRRSGGEVCCYLGPSGCLIPRFGRPWICTWYICADQKNYLAGHQEIAGDRLQSEIESIRMLRKQMEKSFIDAVATDG